MTSAPTRYFAHRAPNLSGFQSDDSDDENHEKEIESPPQPKRPAPTIRRPRIAARIVTPASDVSKSDSYRGTDSGFVPVNTTVSNEDIPSIHANDDSSPSSNSYSGSESSERSLESVDGDCNSESNRGLCHNQLGDELDEDDVHDSVRPVFRTPNLGAAQRKYEEEVQRANQRDQQRLELRHAEARRLLAQTLQDEEKRREAQCDIENLPDDEDRPEHRDADYALWRVREILRIRRDRDEQRAWVKRTVVPQRTTNENDDTDLSKRITQNEVVQESAPNLIMESAHEKPALLQKMYKIGPFFMEKTSDGRYTEEIYNRDYSKMAGEDTVDKDAVPKSP